MHEFSNKPWSASGLDKLIKKTDDSEGTEYRPYYYKGSGITGMPISLNQKIGHLTALT